MQYPLSSFFLRGCVARRSKSAHISRSSPHQVLGNSHEKRLDVDEVLYQHYVKKLLVGYLSRCLRSRQIIWCSPQGWDTPGFSHGEEVTEEQAAWLTRFA